MKFIRPLLGCALRFVLAPAGCATRNTSTQSGSGGSGINRVFVRSALNAGDIKVTATRAGLTSGTATVTAKTAPVVNGLL